MSAVDSKTYKANCHCGKVKYTVEVALPLEAGHQVMSCNCSICIRDGKWNIYIPRDKIQFIQGQDAVKVELRPAEGPPGAPLTMLAQTYNFLSLTHAFCPECGTSLYCHLSDPNAESADEWALNVRAFYGVDMSKLKFQYANMQDKGAQYGPGW